MAIELGLAPGVSVAPAKEAKVTGSVLQLVGVDKSSPISYGMDPAYAALSPNGMAFGVSNLTASSPNSAHEPEAKRVTGRGGPEEQDIPQGRVPAETESLPTPKPWQAAPVNEEQERNNPRVIPVRYRPQVIARFAEAKELLLAGLLDHAADIAENPVVVDAHLGNGNVLLFAINPVYRGETIGTYPLVLNAIANFAQLSRAALSE